MLAAYARVSTTGQNIETQLRELREHCSRNGITQFEIFQDVASGSTTSRPQLDLMLEEVRSGKIKHILVFKLDRLGRSLTHLLNLLAEFRNKGIRLVSIADGLDTRHDSPMSRAFQQLLGIFAELERAMIQERVKSGLERAKAAGKKLGRPHGSRDKSKRSVSGYYLRYAGQNKTQRKLGTRKSSGGKNGHE